MSLLLQFVDICLHLPKHLNGLANDMGAWLYVLMFVVVFCETGLVVTPFLPGDSLLFAFGRSGSHQRLSIELVGLDRPVDDRRHSRRRGELLGRPSTGAQGLSLRKLATVE